LLGDQLAHEAPGYPVLLLGGCGGLFGLDADFAAYWRKLTSVAARFKGLSFGEPAVKLGCCGGTGMGERCGCKVFFLPPNGSAERKLLA
jgi:hypothetical protein